MMNRAAVVVKQLNYIVKQTARNPLHYWIAWVPLQHIRLNNFYFSPNPVIVFKDLCLPEVSACQRQWLLN